ncbi:MAG TPA: hypothetical protein VKB52_09000 [Rhodanobacteraceae bacterium]|nr:hypothetical protein [Rhodanobacteraceae bacterium]
MRIAALVIATSIALGGAALAAPLGSGITYQGLMADNGVPASGSYDFQFALYGAAGGGSPIGSVDINDLVVSGGLIDATLDFGAAAYTGQALWVEVRVRPGASTGAYTTLSPRQSLAATPFALGLPVPYNRAVADANPAFEIHNSGGGPALWGASGGQVGVRGVSDTSAGVWGSSNSFDAIRGESISGAGVTGFSDNNFGVYGSSGTFDGAHGESSSGYGTVGISSTAAGVAGFSAGFDGIQGRTGSTSFAGVSGFGGHYGVYGEPGDPVPDYAMYANGDFGSSGTKFFVEPHPTDATKEIRYITLEGREAGTYFRGTAQLRGGLARIEIPDDFAIVTADAGLTTQLTPVGAAASLYVVERSLDGIVVAGTPDVVFDYQVNGVRKAYADAEPIAENRDFVPDSPDATRFSKLPPESQRRMIENGTLNADGSVNLATVRRLGWDRRAGWTEMPKQRPTAGADAP